jgi:bifunctional oligoribonuclease and PAP phosphatase NrnA
MIFDLQLVREVAQRLLGASRVSIVVHKSPDGDAIGSASAFKGMLSKLGISSTILVPDVMPDFLKWLPGAEGILVYDEQPDACGYQIRQSDIIVCLDFNDLSRIEKLGHFVGDAGAYKVMIDHHQEPAQFANAMFSVTKANSTAVLVYEFFKTAGWLQHLDKEIAAGLYCGIMTDTGSFKYSGVTSETHRIIAELLETGLDHTAIHRDIYDTNTENRIRLNGYAISEKLRVFPDYKAAYIFLTEQELERFNYQKGDTEGLVNQALSLAEVELAAFFSQKDKRIKMSFRSKGNLAVNRIAKEYFNGGGHINASGGIMEGSMEEALAKFETLLPIWVKEKV